MQLHRRQSADALCPGNAKAAVRGKVQGAVGERLRENIHLRQALRICFYGNRRLCRRAPETVTVNEPYEFQLLEQGIKLRLIVFLPKRILRLKFDRSLRDNGSKLIGEISAVLSLGQLLPQLGPDRGVLQIGINTIQRTEFQQQIRGGLGAHPGNTGDIV